MTLTPQQQRVAELVAEGWSNKDIAVRLGICIRRVEQIITAIAKRWDLDPKRSYRVQIARRAA